MGAQTLCNAVHCYCWLLALLLCFQLLHPSQAFKLRGGDGEEEKVPLAVIVPDPSPQMSSAPLAAPPPASGGGGAVGDDVRPRLPTERWRRGRGEARRCATPTRAPAASSTHKAAAPAVAPAAAGPARAAPVPAPAAAAVRAEAPAPESGGGTAFIKSSPAVPVPRGVTDTETILPMPAPGEKRQDAGAANSARRVCMVPLMLGFIIIASFGLY
ncbi:hypothetical protein ACP4OV_006465 [Aristida adscensionis]